MLPYGCTDEPAVPEVLRSMKGNKMNELGGYIGRFLNVDLARDELTDELPAESLLRSYIGGYGLGARILYERMPAGADALGPDNLLGFVTGPLTGTPAIMGCRYCTVAGPT